MEKDVQKQTYRSRRMEIGARISDRGDKSSGRKVGGRSELQEARVVVERQEGRSRRQK